MIQHNIQTEILKILQHRVSQVLPHNYFVQASLYEDYLTGYLVAQLHAHLAASAEPVKLTEVVAKVPLTWLDHLRHEHFPNFLVGKFPIKYKEISRTYVKTVYTVRQDVPVNEVDVRRGYKEVFSYRGFK